MEEKALSMDNKISVRLSAVNFPTDRDAIVEFELFSYKTNEPSNRILAKITRAVPRYTKEPDNRIADYDLVVRVAAQKLEEDFKMVLAVLGKSYSADS